MSKQSDAETPGKKFNIDLNEKVNGFRKGITKKELIKSLDKDDWRRIEEMKYFEQFDRDSITARIVLQNDTVRAQRDTMLDNIQEMIGNIRNVMTTNKRKQEQIDSGVIIDELKPGLLMTADELKFEIHAGERIIKNTQRRIVHEMGSLRNVVGSHDLLKNEIMSEKQYDALVLKVEKDLKKLGVELFDIEVQHVGKK